jgi:O-antigen/teichoic acid export membrane protein
MKLTRSVRHNIIANFTGNVWRGIFNLAFIPVYIKLMGVEVYGLLGIFMSLSALFVLLDMGLSTTLSRELSRLSVIENSAQESRNLVRTFEVVYWLISIVIGASVIILAPLIAEYWINSASISTEIIEQTLLIMGMLLAFQWPRAIYIGGLEGLQRQVLYNVIKTLSMLARHIGAVLVLTFISPSILYFFYWQSIVALITTIVLAVYLWKSLPESNGRSKFDKNLFVKNWKFVSGVMGISLGTVLLTQIDKIILSKMLTLEVFSYYMLATTVATVIMSLVSPIHTALFPKLSQLVVKKDENGISDLYHRGCQLASIIILPISITMIFFSKEILSTWIGDPTVVNNTHMLLSLLIVGTTIKAYMTLPYTLQLAHGWTKLAFYKNVIAVIIIIPSMLWAAQMYQGIGAAWVLIILYLGLLIFEINIMHKRILKDNMRKRYGYDVFIPVLIVSIIGLATHEIHDIFPIDVSEVITALAVLCTLLFSFMASAWATGNLNVRVMSLLKIKERKKIV